MRGVPVRAVVRCRRCVVGGFPCSENRSIRPGRANPQGGLFGRPSASTLLTWRLMPKTPHPVARWSVIGFLWTSKVFHSGFFAAFAAIPCRVDHPGVISRCRFPLSGKYVWNVPLRHVGVRGGASSHKCKRSERARKRKPRNCYQQSGAVFGRRLDKLCGIPSADMQSNCKSSKVQSAIPSGGGTCNLLNTPLSVPRRFLSLPVWLWVRCRRLSSVGAIAPPLGSHAQAWPPWGARSALDLIEEHLTDNSTETLYRQRVQGGVLVKNWFFPEDWKGTKEGQDFVLKVQPFAKGGYEATVRAVDLEKIGNAMLGGGVRGKREVPDVVPIDNQMKAAQSGKCGTWSKT